MQRNLVITVVGAAVLVSAGVAYARDHGPRDIQATFAELDLNSDGTVTRGEIEEARNARFAAADADGDGALTEEEFVNARIEEVRTRAAAEFQRLDADGDGSLSRDAIEAKDRRARGLDRMFSRVDRNGDDAVTEEEFEAAMARFKEFRERSGGHGKRQ